MGYGFIEIVTDETRVDVQYIPHTEKCVIRRQLFLSSPLVW